MFSDLSKLACFSRQMCHWDAWRFSNEAFEFRTVFNVMRDTILMEHLEPAGAPHMQCRLREPMVIRLSLNNALFWRVKCLPVWCITIYLQRNKDIFQDAASWRIFQNIDYLNLLFVCWNTPLKIVDFITIRNKFILCAWILKAFSNK